jgi:hypothetical protein
MYNVVLRSGSRVEEISITNSECMSVALGIQPAMRTRHIVICGLSGSSNFPHIFSKTAEFSKKKKKSIQNVSFDFLHNFCCLQHFTF